MRECRLLSLAALVGNNKLLGWRQHYRQTSRLSFGAASNNTTLLAEQLGRAAGTAAAGGGTGRWLGRRPPNAVGGEPTDGRTGGLGGHNIR